MYIYIYICMYICIYIRLYYVGPSVRWQINNFFFKTVLVRKRIKLCFFPTMRKR